MSGRFRACQACQKLKNKCEISTSDPLACERCVRLQITCTPALSRRQRDRIAELEDENRKLNAALLEARSSTASAASTATRTVKGESFGPRSQQSPGDVDSTHDGSDLQSFLNALLTREQQARGLAVFEQLMLGAWPVMVSVNDTTPTNSSKSPAILFAIFGFAVSYRLFDSTADTQNRLRKRAMRYFGSASVGLEQPSHELVQALLVATMWNRPASDPNHGNCSILLRTAREVAVELGLGGPNMLSSAPAFFTRLREPPSLPMKGTWMACYTISIMSDINNRRMPAHRCTKWDMSCFQELCRSNDTSIQVLCRYVRVAQLQESIASQLRLCDMEFYCDFSRDDVEPQLRLVSEAVKVKHDTQTDNQLISNILIFWHYHALVLTYEPVLHTPTNKTLFAAPYVALRIGVTDFAHPQNITSEQQEIFRSLATACQAAIEVVCDIPPESLLNSPSFVFAPAVGYVLSIMVKMYVAISAPGNTYGRVLRREVLQLRPAIQKLKRVNAALLHLDPNLESWNTRIIGSVDWLETWLDEYEEIVRRYEANVE